MKFSVVTTKYVYWENEEGHSCRSTNGNNYEECMGCSWEGEFDLDEDDENIKRCVKSLLKEKKDGEYDMGLEE